MSKRTFRLVIILAIIVFIAFLIANKAGLFEDEKEVSGPPQGLQKPVVAVKILSDTTVTDKINTSGTLLADEQVTLTAEINGKVEEILFEEGQQVRKGQVLVRIDDKELQAQLQRLQHQKQLLEKEENRQKKLLEKNGISQQAYDETLTELNTTKSEISRIEAQIDNARIIAPFDGLIGLRHISEGAYVNPNSKIAEFVKNDKLKLEFSVPEDYAGMLNPGGMVYFTTGNSDSLYQAEIYAVESSIDLSTRTLTGRAHVENKDKTLFPGAFANVEIRFRQYDNAVLIPPIALIPDIDGQKVYLYQNGKANPVEVEAALRTKSYLMISEGLKPGDTLITSGILNLRPGIEVEVKNIETHGNQ